jgi:single-strand DNA-binding protein
MNVNQCFLIGHVTRDPEVKEIGSEGSKVASFRLAVNRSYKKGGKWVDKPTFVDCEAWAHKADYIESRVQKGTEVWLRGRLESDEWEKDGERRNKHKIYVLEIQVGKNRREAVAVATDNAPVDEYPF